MKNFFLHSLILLISGLPALLIFSLVVVALAAPLALFSRSRNPPKALVVPFFALLAGGQVYFWGLWAAFCVAATYHYTTKPEVTWNWLYWAAGFVWCASLIGYLSHNEQLMSESTAEAAGVQKGTMFYSLIALAAYVAFAIWPRLMIWPYGWFLHLVGLGRYAA